MGSLLTVFFRAGAPRDWRRGGASDRGRTRRFFGAMLDQGILLPPSPFEAWFVSSAHGDGGGRADPRGRSPGVRRVTAGAAPATGSVPAPRPEARYLRAARSLPVDTTPVWFMRQAGRSLPEYRAIRRRATLLEITRDPALCAEVTLQPVRRLGVDAAILFADITTPLAGLGRGVRHREGGGPVIEQPIRTLADVEALRPFEPEAAVAPLLEAIRLVRRGRRSPDRVRRARRSRSPATSWRAARRGTSLRTKALMHAEPGTWAALLDRLADATVATCARRSTAGAEARPAVRLLGRRAGPAGLRAPRAALDAALFDGIAGLGVPVTHFGTGTGGLLGAPGGGGRRRIGLDWRIALAEGGGSSGDRAVQGNLDPVAAAGAVGRRRGGARAGCSTQNGGRPGHMFNLGHGVLPATDPDQLRRLVDLVHEAARARESVLVVGGGITGLVAARALALRGVPVTLVEAGPRLGGKAWTERVDGLVIEHGPDAFVATRPACSTGLDLGLGDQLVVAKEPRGVAIRPGDAWSDPRRLRARPADQAMPFVRTRLFAGPRSCGWRGTSSGPRIPARGRRRGPFPGERWARRRPARRAARRRGLRDADRRAVARRGGPQLRVGRARSTEPAARRACRPGEGRRGGVRSPAGASRAVRVAAGRGWARSADGARASLAAAGADVAHRLRGRADPGPCRDRRDGPLHGRSVEPVRRRRIATPAPVAAQLLAGRCRPRRRAGRDPARLLDRGHARVPAGASAREPSATATWSRPPRAARSRPAPGRARSGPAARRTTWSCPAFVRDEPWIAADEEGSRRPARRSSGTLRDHGRAAPGPRRAWRARCPATRSGTSGASAAIDAGGRWPAVNLAGASYRGRGLPDCVTPGAAAAALADAWFDSGFARRAKATGSCPRRASRRLSLTGQAPRAAPADGPSSRGRTGSGRPGPGAETRCRGTGEAASATSSTVPTGVQAFLLGLSIGR